MSPLNQGQKYNIPVKPEKTKLYQCDPLDDPIAERNRLNALNAKKNRDKKKNDLLQAKLEIERLQEENQTLRAEREEYRNILELTNKKLNKLRELLNKE